MNQQEINKLAANSLISRAMWEVKTQGCAYMLIDTAKRLDESIDQASWKELWLDNWLMHNADRMDSVNVTL